MHSPFIFTKDSLASFFSSSLHPSPFGVQIFNRSGIRTHSCAGCKRSGASERTRITSKVETLNFQIQITATIATRTASKRYLQLTRSWQDPGEICTFIFDFRSKSDLSLGLQVSTTDASRRQDALQHWQHCPTLLASLLTLLISARSLAFRPFN